MFYWVASPFLSLPLQKLGSGEPFEGSRGIKYTIFRRHFCLGALGSAAYSVLKLWGTGEAPGDGKECRKIIGGRKTGVSSPTSPTRARPLEMVSLLVVNGVSGPSQFTNLRVLLSDNQKARSAVLETADWAWMIEDGERRGRRRRNEQLELRIWLWMPCWNGGLRYLAWRKATSGCVHRRERWCRGCPEQPTIRSTQSPVDYTDMGNFKRISRSPFPSVLFLKTDASEGRSWVSC